MDRCPCELLLEVGSSNTYTYTGAPVCLINCIASLTIKMKDSDSDAVEEEGGGSSANPRKLQCMLNDAHVLRAT